MRSLNGRLNCQSQVKTYANFTSVRSETSSCHCHGTEEVEVDHESIYLFYLQTNI